jgi:hypothetical protein
MSTSEGVGWNPSPNTRGTFDILWSCLSVLLVCTYTAVHLNLPSPQERVAKFPQVLWFSAGARHIKWMFVVAIAPEIAVAMAIEDWANARRSYKKMRDEGLEPDWTMTHAFFAGSAHLDYEHRRPYKIGPVIGAPLLCFIGIYVAARFCIIVQMFACFRSSPPGLYQDVDFSRYLPHLS